MPVAIPIEWAIVKVPSVARPFIRSRGAISVAINTIMNQDPVAAARADLSLTVDEQLFAMNVSEMLNREIRHDGYWMVSWSDPEPILKKPLELVVRWLDADKDVQFRVWFEGPSGKAMAKPLEEIVEACENAWQQWLEVDKHWLAVSPGQKVKAQKGERVDMPHLGPQVFGA